MNNRRKEEFDVLRALIIISAIILHFSNRFDLGILEFPSRFVQKQIFNVGSFFFFTAGYMAYKIYLVRFQNNAVKTTIKLLRKGLEILLVYIGYVTFLRLSTGASIPTDLYDFIYGHEFYTKVLVTFSAIYIVSPVIIALYWKSKQLCFLLISLIFSIYCVLLYVPSPETIIHSEIVGTFWGLGNKQISYPILPAIIIYFIGFYISSIEQQLISNTSQSRILSWASLPILVLHALFVASSDTYKATMNLEPIDLLTTSIFIFLSLIFMRRLLSLKIANSILTKKAIILIGSKTLTFYLTSNLILNFLTFPKESIMAGKIVVFLLLFALTYLVTAWNFYSDYYRKLSSRNT
ncbi:acyltransferase family protein [Pleurocapsa sp. PCC 7319]|uniref:acyltransferase family protein n=1 Tax=Pleurocapsa sp. PCC 7319 TaxID=118161 RepID=UPI00034C9ACB|nr:acyltransferase family protein [Pleurocapsa sp. PCC 7319]